MKGHNGRKRAKISAFVVRETKLGGFGAFKAASRSIKLSRPFRYV